MRRECVRAVRAEHALGVVWCDACERRPFSRVGNYARRLSLGEAWTHHTPTLRVDALPPRGASTHISCTTVRCDLSSTNHSGGENYQGSRGSTAQRSLRKPLPLAFSWIWSCEESEKLRGYQPGWETTCGKCLKLHAASLSTWRVPRNTENDKRARSDGSPNEP